MNKTYFQVPGNDKVFTWEWFLRPTTKVINEDSVDGVDCIPFVYFKDNPVPKLLLIANYRIPVNKYVLEFPAGLLDEGEDIEVCGLRELKEETGYSGEVFKEL